MPITVQRGQFITPNVTAEFTPSYDGGYDPSRDFVFVNGFPAGSMHTAIPQSPAFGTRDAACRVYLTPTGNVRLERAPAARTNQNFVMPWELWSYRDPVDDAEFEVIGQFQGVMGTNDTFVQVPIPGMTIADGGYVVMHQGVLFEQSFLSTWSSAQGQIYLEENPSGDDFVSISRGSSGGLHVLTAPTYSFVVVRFKGAWQTSQIASALCPTPGVVTPVVANQDVGDWSKAFIANVTRQNPSDGGIREIGMLAFGGLNTSTIRTWLAPGASNTTEDRFSCFVLSHPRINRLADNSITGSGNRWENNNSTSLFPWLVSGIPAADYPRYTAGQTQSPTGTIHALPDELSGVRLGNFLGFTFPFFERGFSGATGIISEIASHLVELPVEQPPSFAMLGDVASKLGLSGAVGSALGLEGTRATRAGLSGTVAARDAGEATVASEDTLDGSVKGVP